ncbi:MAG: hypothetical protein DRP54_06965, partial [Spirochaetes bacterium]
SKLTQPESLKKYLEVIHNIDKKEIERRKDLYRRSWNYRKVDHIPIGIWLDDFSEYSLKEQCENLDIQFTVNVKNISRCLKCIPDDYIPYARICPYHSFLNLVTQLQIDCYREIIKAAGGINRLTSIDFDPLWAPEGYKCFVSDDVCAAISPDTFRTFSKPYIEMIFRAFEGGRLHNCGPHPAVKYYLNNEIGLKGLNCSYRYTRSNLQALKEAFKGYGIVEFNFDNNETAEEIIKGFEEIANSLAPDVIGMPLVFLNETWKDDEITSLYHELRKISELYARELNFKND